MSLYALKPRFQALLRPVVRLLHGIGLTANQVTVGTCAVSLVLGVALAFATWLTSSTDGWPWDGDQRARELVGRQRQHGVAVRRPSALAQARQG